MNIKQVDTCHTLSPVPRTEDTQLKVTLGNSPAVQWLELGAHCSGPGFSLWSGTKTVNSMAKIK